MKKPLLQKKIIWVLIICVIGIGSCEFRAKNRDKANDQKQEQLSKEADKVLKGKVKIPSTLFKTKEEVNELFKAADLTPSFVVSNFDKKATSNKHFLKVDECDQINKDQPNVEYFDMETVGDKYGPYADKGSIIIVGYSDHDFDGTEKKKTSASKSDKKATKSTITSSTNEIAQANENWYADDSQYATMEPVEKTVEAQMKEINVDDPVRAIVVNEIQNYLSSLDGAEHAATDINQSLEYSRFGFYIDMKYDGEKPTKQLMNKIIDELKRISGHKFTIE